MTVSFNARPVYVVFATDRLEVITAAEIAPQDLKEARLEQFRELPVWGPALAAARVEEKDQQDALDWALAGKDITVRPKFFVPYADELPKIKARMRPLSELRRATEDPLVAKKLAEASESTMWLPVQHKNGFWTALVDSATALPIDYIPLDPYDAISRVSRRQ